MLRIQIAFAVSLCYIGLSMGLELPYFKVEGSDIASCNKPPTDDITSMVVKCEMEILEGCKGNSAGDKVCICIAPVEAFLAMIAAQGMELPKADNDFRMVCGTCGGDGLWNLEM